LTAAKKNLGQINRRVKGVLALEQSVLQPELIGAKPLNESIGERKMVVCPNCGSKIQARKVLVLNNVIPITCPVCSSKLQVENKVFFSAIGGVGAAVVVVFGLLLRLFFKTLSVAYLGLLTAVFVAVLLVAAFLMLRFVKLKVELPNYA